MTPEPTIFVAMDLLFAVQSLSVTLSLSTVFTIKQMLFSYSKTSFLSGSL